MSKPTSKCSLMVPDISYNGDRTILEYVFTDHTRYNMCSKNKIVDFIPETVEGKCSFLKRPLFLNSFLLFLLCIQPSMT